MTITLMGFDGLAERVHANARAKGFWDHERLVVRDPVLGDVDGRPRNPSIDGEKIALMHSELSEALDALRDGRMTGSHSVEEELADTIIRILDFAHARGLSMDQAIAAKIARNAERPRLHGRRW